MSAPQPSRVPLAAAALVAIGERMRDAGLVDLVLYGPTPKGPTEGGVTLAVLVTDRAADQTSDLLPGQVNQYVETTEIVCNVVSWSGGTDLVQHVEACAAVWDGLRTRIEGDQTLGGICEVATMGRRVTWSPENGDAGANVILAFTVRILAYV
jgi:hypothetical protein